MHQSVTILYPGHTDGEGGLRDYNHIRGGTQNFGHEAIGRPGQTTISWFEPILTYSIEDLSIPSVSKSLPSPTTKIVMSEDFASSTAAEIAEPSSSAGYAPI